MYFILNFLGHTLPKLLDLVFEMCLRKRAETKQKYILYSLHKLLLLLYQETAGEKTSEKELQSRKLKQLLAALFCWNRILSTLLSPHLFLKACQDIVKLMSCLFNIIQAKNRFPTQSHVSFSLKRDRT